MDLRRLGVVAGDVVMVHASLRSVGPVLGRAAGVVSALDQAVGPSGTWLMVLGAHDDWAWVNERPEEEREALLADAEPFDPLTARAESELGVLAEVFRTHPGTLVSDHPEGRFGARGERAAELMHDPPWDDYYGPGSALERLLDLHGKVLRLGADTDTTTLIHYAEYLTPLPDKRRVRRYRAVKTPGGKAIRTVSCLDDSSGIVDFPTEDYFAVILREYFATGRARIGQVGRAPSELIDGRDLVAFARDWMTANLPTR